MRIGRSLTDMGRPILTSSVSRESHRRLKKRLPWLGASVFKRFCQGGGMMFFEFLTIATLVVASDEVAVVTAPSEGELRLREAAPELSALPDVVLVAYPVSGRTSRAVRTAMNAV